MRWRSALLSFCGFGAIVSIAAEGVRGEPLSEGATPFGTVGAGCAEGEGEGGPTSQFVRLVDADFPCAPPNNPNVWSKR